ncbi:MAG: response regulator [Prolixibacteraceae bacterium]|nr:response regulator [Prolixibacteraceae bacterium]
MIHHLPKSLILLYFFLHPILVFTQTSEPIFRSIPIDVVKEYHFLPKGVLKDHKGYIWVFADHHLLRYDGQKMENYTLQLETVMGKASIINIQKERKGTLLLLSSKGELIRIYDNIIQPVTAEVEFPLLKNRPNGFWIKEETLWIGMSNDRLTEYNWETKKTKHYQLPSSTGRIQDLTLLNNGTIWIATKKGSLLYLSLGESQFKQTQLLKNIHSSWIKLEAGASPDELWIGTENKGLFRYTPDSWVNYSKDSPSLLHRIKSNFIYSLHLDPYNHLWVGTDGAGLIELDTKGNIISSTIHQPYNELSLGSNAVVALAQIAQNEMWIITNSGNIRTYHRKDKGVGYHYGQKYSIPTRTLGIYINKKGEKWFSTDGDGILYEGIKDTLQIRNNNFHLNGNYVQCITEDKQNNIWYGTYQSGVGYLDTTKHNHTFKLFADNGKEVKDVRSIYVDPQNNKWIGSQQGVHCINHNNEDIRHFSLSSFSNTTGPILYMEQIQNNQLLVASHTDIFVIENYNQIAKTKISKIHIEEDKPFIFNTGEKQSDDTFLFAFRNNGLFQWSGKIKDPIIKFKNLNTHNIRSIESIRDSLLYMTTDNGIIEYNLSQNKLYQWDRENAEIINNYDNSCSFQHQDKIYFGGSKGVTILDTHALEKRDNRPSSILINKLQIGNRDASKVFKNLSGYNDIKKLELKHDQNAFRIVFSSRHSSLDIKERYRYKLNGFDTNWLRPLSVNEITYTNIPSGNYQLIIEKEIGINKKTRKIIDISIANPLWLQWWAITLYFCIAIVLFYFLIHLITRWKFLNQKLELESWKRKEKEKFYNMKIELYSKMSREIQTPLSLLMMPIDSIIEALDDQPELAERVQKVKSHAVRLSSITKNMFFSKENNELLEELKIKSNNLKDHLQQTIDIFHKQAKQKHINLTLDYHPQQTLFCYDKDKMTHVWFNILSNAFRFTPEYGHIRFEVKHDRSQQVLQMIIEDNGCGIPDQKQDHIFDMFYQYEHSSQKEGVGVGLAVCQEIIFLHQGSIQLAPTPNGAKFIIQIPQKTDTSIKRENRQEEVNRLLKYTDSPFDGSPSLPSHILIVESHIEMRDYLVNYLKKTFHVTAVENSREAIDKTEKHHFDLILSNLEIDYMDGIGLYNKIHQNPQSKNIPFIIISGNHSSIQRKKALRLGIIDYITKPFDIEELKIRIQNQIRVKEKQKIETDNYLYPSSQHSLIYKLETILNQKLSNTNLSMEEVANKLQMSYSSLYKKVTAEIGVTPNEFLTLKRMKKAEQELTYNEKTIAEIANICGYSDPKYFSKIFKKHHSISPKQFRANKTKI